MATECQGRSVSRRRFSITLLYKGKKRKENDGIYSTYLPVDHQKCGTPEKDGKKKKKKNVEKEKNLLYCDPIHPCLQTHSPTLSVLT